MPTGTKSGWTIVVAAGFGLVLLIIWITYSRSTHRRDEVLAERLINEFHQQYNLTEIGKANEDSSPNLVRIRQIRTELGMFRRIRSCKIRDFSEPPMLTAECLSRFDRGEAQESFIFGDYQKDHPLVLIPQHSYASQFLSAGIQSNRPVSKVLRLRWAGVGGILLGGAAATRGC
jgi:hypothetical protein